MQILWSKISDDHAHLQLLRMCVSIYWPCPIVIDTCWQSSSKIATSTTTHSVLRWWCVGTMCTKTSGMQLLGNSCLASPHHWQQSKELLRKWTLWIWKFCIVLQVPKVVRHLIPKTKYSWSGNQTRHGIAELNFHGSKRVCKKRENLKNYLPRKICAIWFIFEWWSKKSMLSHSDNDANMEWEGLGDLITCGESSSIRMDTWREWWFQS